MERGYRSFFTGILAFSLTGKGVMTGFFVSPWGAAPKGPASRKRCSIEQGMGETVIVCASDRTLYR